MMYGSIKIKEKRLLCPISIVDTQTYERRSPMFTIGRMPHKTKSFFNPVQSHFKANGFSHFWQLVLAMTISHGSTIERLANLLRDNCTTHRTNHGEFLWRSKWDESWALWQIASDTLRRLDRMGIKDKQAYLIIDDTQTLKRAKKMEGVGKIHHHATNTYGNGHTIFKVCLYIAGVTIPLGSYLYIKKEHAGKLGVPFKKLTQLAVESIANCRLPDSLNVTVLFDAFYLCPAVAKVCKSRHWHYISVGKSNRCFIPEGQNEIKKLGKYGKNVLRKGFNRTIEGLKSKRRYRLAQRIGHLRGLGKVKVIFSRRRGDSSIIALVTDDMNASATSIVRRYLKRWAIEMLIKDEKQNLGLGDYRVKRCRAVVRHLHLVDCAYLCLTHLALDAPQGAQSKKTKTVLCLPPISQLKCDMRRRMWQEAVKDVVKVSHEKKVIRRLEKLMAAA